MREKYGLGSPDANEAVALASKVEAELHLIREAVQPLTGTRFPPMTNLAATSVTAQ